MHQIEIVPPLRRIALIGTSVPRQCGIATFTDDMRSALVGEASALSCITVAVTDSGTYAYPWLIHRLTYRRTNHPNIHVRGFKEEGTTTTPFDMVVLNDLDRFHLAMDVIDRVPGLVETAAHAKQAFRDRLIEHAHYVKRYGEDMPDIQAWSWPYKTAAAAGD